MKNVHKRPASTFRDKYLAVVIAVMALISTCCEAQDSLKYSNINGYGFRYKRHEVDSLNLLPLSTSPFNPYRAGAIRFDSTNKTLQMYYQGAWKNYGKAVQLTDSTFKVGIDTILIRGNGSGSGSPNSNIGSGFRLAVPLTNNIITLFAGLYTSLDSSSNTNGITIKADSAALSGYYLRRKDSTLYTSVSRLRDTAAALRTAIGTGGGGGISGLTPNRIPYATSSTTIGDDSKLTWNPTNKTLAADTTRFIRVQADTIGNVVRKMDSMVLVVYGNSVAAGTGAPVSALRFSTQLAKSLGYTEDNHGVSGMTLEKQTPLATSNFIDALSAIPLWNANKKFVIIEFGINDIVQMEGGLTNYNTTNYRAAWNQALDTFAAKNYPMGSIMLMATPYIDSNSRSIPSLWGSIRRSVDSVTAAAAANYGCIFYDAWTRMKNRGAEAYVSSDKIHPNGIGHMFISDDILPITDSLYYRRQTLAMRGLIELDSLKLSSPKIMSTTSVPVVRDSTGRLGIGTHLNFTQLNLAGRFFQGNGTLNGPELFISTGGLKAGYGRFTDAVPGLPSGNCVEFGLFNNQIIGSVRAVGSSGTENELHLNYGGGPVVFRTTSSVTNGADIWLNGVTNVTGEFRAQGPLSGFSAGAGIRMAWLSNIGYIAANNGATWNPISVGVFGGNLLVGHNSDVSGLVLNVLGRTKVSSLQLGTTASTTEPIYALQDNSTTNAVDILGRFVHTSTGTAAAGFGTGFRFDLENASGTQVNAANIEVPWTTATNGSESADIVFKGIRAGTLTENLRIVSSGTLKFNGVPSGSGTVLTIGTDSLLRQTSAASIVSAANITSGNYTPTISNTSNIDATSVQAAQYHRNGNHVIVYLELLVDPTAATATTFTISLPFASDFISGFECIGMGNCSAVPAQVITISADNTNNVAAATFTATNTGSQAFFMTFSYEIL